MSVLLPQVPVDEVCILDSCDSTQLQARAMLDASESATTLAVAARTQTHGQGRAGRSWVNAPGELLLVSVAVRGRLGIGVLEGLSRRVALGVRDAVACQLPQAASCITWKEPNDLLDATSGAKLGGVLIDARTVGVVVEQVIVGIGLNLDADPFELEDGRAGGSVRSACGAPIDGESLRSDVIGHVAWLLQRDD